MNDGKVENIFQKQLKELVNREKDTHPEIAWHDIQKTVETVVIFTANLNQKVRKNQWISVASTKLIDTRKFIPSGSGHEEHRQPKHRLIKSLTIDDEQWWLVTAEEMEKTVAVGKKYICSDCQGNGY